MSDGKNSTCDERLAIYNQDCEFYRYQDGLRWNRFQTIIVIESAIVASIFQSEFPLTIYQKQGLTSVGFIIILFVCLLSIKDKHDTNFHFSRIKEFEKGVDKKTEPNQPKQVDKTKRGFLRLCLSRYIKMPSIGSFLMYSIIIMINATNGVILYFLANFNYYLMLCITFIFLAISIVADCVSISRDQNTRPQENA